MAPSCIWVRGPSEQIDRQKALHTLCPACARHVTLSHPQITIALGYLLVAANLLYTSIQEANEIHLSLHDIPKLILIRGRHGTSTTFSCHIWGGEFPVGAHVHPVNGARLILRTLYEHLTNALLDLESSSQIGSGGTPAMIYQYDS